MKRVLCYGDSNTHGSIPMANPVDCRRYDETTRWPGVMGATLGRGYKIIEEGLPGRTTVQNDPIEGDHMNGLSYLTPCLFSHWPLDVIVLMLGTNDCKKRFSLPPVDIAAGAGLLLTTIKRGTPVWTRAPKLLLIAPAPVISVGWLGEIFIDGEERSRSLAKYYAEQAPVFGAAFFDAATVARVSPVDGVHLEAADHRALGQAIALAVQRLLS